MNRAFVALIFIVCVATSAAGTSLLFLLDLHTSALLSFAAVVLSAIASVFFLLEVLRRRGVDSPLAPALIESIGKALYPEGGFLSHRRLLKRVRDEIFQGRERVREHETLLDSLDEGIIVVDRNDRVVGINRAAETFVGVRRGEATGRLLHEILRNAELLDLLTRVAGGTVPAPIEIRIRADEERITKAYGRKISHPEPTHERVILVLNDITEIRHLENVRRDFVANVSHELRTPITSIKGAAETLLEGAISDPKASESFLGMIVRHSQRLDDLFRDLLVLSGLEHDDESPMNRSLQELLPIIQGAVELADSKARESGITIDIICNGELKGYVNPGLLQEAIMNLVDNAIKYSEVGTKVTVSAVAFPEERIILTVKDEGVGIPQDQLSRIFERFYRVDAGRTREKGGTGLGLAIVKHIVQAHGGSVEVASSVGKGSEFRIILPN